MTAAGRTLRVSVRPGTDRSVTPLLLMNGIGASLEVLQPFVDALDPRRTVIRFDVPGVGGSPRPVVPYNLATFSPVVAGVLDRLGFDGPGRRPRAVLGRWAGAALRRPAPRAGAGGSCSSAPGRDRSWCRRTRGCWPGCSPRGGTGTPSTRAASPGRSTAARCAPTPSGPPACCTRRPGSGRGAATTTSWPPAPGWSSLPFLRLIRQPTLIVAGDDDPIVPVVNARIMARLLPDAPAARLRRRPHRADHRGRPSSHR